jgi:hypothetical protein
MTLCVGVYLFLLTVRNRTIAHGELGRSNAVCTSIHTHCTRPASLGTVVRINYYRALLIFTQPYMYYLSLLELHFK